jgi:hypothetical protein
VEKISNNPQPPLKGLFGVDHFGQLEDMQVPLEDKTKVYEEIQALENNLYLLKMMNLE